MKLLFWQEITENTKEENSEDEEHNKKTREVKTNKKPGIDSFNYTEGDPKKSGVLSKFVILLVSHLYVTALIIC